MDQELHRILLRRIKIRRLHDEAFDLLPRRAGEPERLQPLHLHLREDCVVEVRELPRFGLRTWREWFGGISEKSRPKIWVSLKTLSRRSLGSLLNIDFVRSLDGH